MNIIDEMRREAGNAERSGHTYESLFMTEWADRLAASGALVPVPDGEACDMWGCNSLFIKHEGSVYVMPSEDCDDRNLSDDWWLCVSDKSKFTADTLDGKHIPTIVQPVRLEPITEAEV